MPRVRYFYVFYRGRELIFSSRDVAAFSRHSEISPTLPSPGFAAIDHSGPAQLVVEAVGGAIYRVPGKNVSISSAKN